LVEAAASGAEVSSGADGGGVGFGGVGEVASSRSVSDRHAGRARGRGESERGEERWRCGEREERNRGEAKAGRGAKVRAQVESGRRAAGLHSS